MGQPEATAGLLGAQRRCGQSRPEAVRALKRRPGPEPTQHGGRKSFEKKAKNREHQGVSKLRTGARPLGLTRAASEREKPPNSRGEWRLGVVGWGEGGEEGGAGRTSHCLPSCLSVRGADSLNLARADLAQR